jgi:hypothetical protein
MKGSRLIRERRPGLKRLAAATLVLSAACASVRWDEQRGVPLAADRGENRRADEAFLDGLTARRRDETVPEPIVTPRLQRELRSIADKVQLGGLSVGEATRESERWGRDAYRREVDVWVLDCERGRDMPLPAALVGAPTVVVAYASVRHRRRLEPAEHCATFVVSVRGAVVVKATTLAPP